MYLYIGFGISPQVPTARAENNTVNLDIFLIFIIFMVLQIFFSLDLETKIKAYYHNNNLIQEVRVTSRIARRGSSNQKRREALIRALQRNLTRVFEPSYCYDGKCVIYYILPL